MNEDKMKVHFMDMDLINAVNPISVNLIGAGGTGSKMLMALMDMNHAMITLGHAGLQVRLWDDDVVTGANLGRQRFASCEIGLPKSVALINRVNRWSGTNWKAETERFDRRAEHVQAGIYISCVDNVASRFAIADILNDLKKGYAYRDTPRYWMDFGNSKDTGQVILSTIGSIKQPDSIRYQTVDRLPFITEEFADLLKLSEQRDDTPSCSLAEALESQDLFINPTLADFGSAMLWKMFRSGMTMHRGLFLNLETAQVQPLKVA